MTNEIVLFLTHADADGALPRLALEALGAATEAVRGSEGATLAVGLVGGIPPPSGPPPPAGRPAGWP